MGCGDSQPAKSGGSGNNDGGKIKRDLELPGKKTVAGSGQMLSIKLVLIGDTAVGKSCLITNYLHNTFSEVYEPTVLDVYRGVKAVRKEQVSLEIHDTSGDENLGTNR